MIRSLLEMKVEDLFNCTYECWGIKLRCLPSTCIVAENAANECMVQHEKDTSQTRTSWMHHRVRKLVSLLVIHAHIVDHLANDG